MDPKIVRRVALGLAVAVPVSEVGIIVFNLEPADDKHMHSEVVSMNPSSFVAPAASGGSGDASVRIDTLSGTFRIG